MLLLREAEEFVLCFLRSAPVAEVSTGSGFFFVFNGVGERVLLAIDVSARTEESLLSIGLCLTEVDSLPVGSSVFTVGSG